MYFGPESLSPKISLMNVRPHLITNVRAKDALLPDESASRRQNRPLRSLASATGQGRFESAARHSTSFIVARSNR